MTAGGFEREGLRVAADYERYLGRSAASFEVAIWVNQFESGALTNEQVVAGFVGSVEYFQNHFSNIPDWLVAAYQDLLGRAPDPAGYNAWLQVLQQG